MKRNILLITSLALLTIALIVFVPLAARRSLAMGSSPVGRDDLRATARLLSNGALDNTFSEDGTLTTDFAGADVRAGGVAVQPDEEPFDCSMVDMYHLEKQTNLLAAMRLAECGRLPKASVGQATSASSVEEAARKVLAPLLYGGADINVVTGLENRTQSSPAIWSNGQTVVVGYVDGRGSSSNAVGASVSTDGGATFTRLTITTTGHSPFRYFLDHPAVLYHAPTGFWLLASLYSPQFPLPSCGAVGIGGYRSTNPSDPNSWLPFCAHVGTSDDQASGWADNNPASPFYGRMYVSWNDFGVGGGAIRTSYSTDGGATWSAPVQVFGSFRRNVQLTGDFAGGGNVYLAALDEGGGGLNNRTNWMYRSTDGGLTWAGVQIGPSFPAAGRGVSGYHAVMYPPNYWWAMGWGQPGAWGNVVHYTYYVGNPGNGDPGNVFYTRSTDAGLTWGAPVQMNTDATTRAQWQPSLSVDQNGGVFIGWYDERETVDPNPPNGCDAPGTSTPCYRRWGRASTDGGVTWLPDEAVGDAISPLPAQLDSHFNSNYIGRFDYAFASGTTHYQAWTDGRVGVPSNQDVWFDRIQNLGDPPTQTPTSAPPTPTSTPTRTHTSTATSTATNTPVSTPTNVPTNTPTSTATSTPTVTSTITAIPSPTPTGSGCAPDFWKNHAELWNEKGDQVSLGVKAAVQAKGMPYAYQGSKGATVQLFKSIFGLTNAQMRAAGLDPRLTLLQAVDLSGDGFQKLARHGVAALLNSVATGVSYPYTPDQVLTGVHDAVIARQAEPLAQQMADANNLTCPLSGGQ
jgi:hypothetical protein